MPWGSSLSLDEKLSDVADRVGLLQLTILHPAGPTRHEHGNEKCKFPR